jgi:biofilm PGA synthesis protein PgaA
MISRTRLRATAIGGALAGAALLLSPAVLAQPVAAAPPSAAAPAADSAQAIAIARAGRHDEALELLRALRTAAPADKGLLHDEIAVLGWAERDAAVLASAAALDADQAPSFVLDIVAKAARNLRRFDEAVLWYRRALERGPDDLDATLGLALTEADRRDQPAAQRALDRVPASRANLPSVLLARAYVAQSASHWLEALRSYEQVLASEPTHPGAARGYALALRALLLPTEALEFAAEHEGILSEAERARLRADEAALRVRLVTSTPYPPAQRSEGFRRALAALDETLATITDPAALAAVRSDRVITLAQANLSREALAEFELLKAATPSPPFEALVAAGRAHLELGEADSALTLLLAASAARPSDVEVRFDLVFAYLAADEPRDALRVADALTRELPALQTGPGAVVTKGNPVALRAELVAALADAYTDRLGPAQRRLETLLAAAPNNAEARQELANVYRWRGWLDRSQSEYRQVLAVNPDALGARAGYAHARLDAAAYGEVERTVDELTRIDAADPTVRRLAERWDVETRSELRLDATDSRSSGTTFGNEQDDVTATWLSQPLGQWRAVALAEYAEAEFPEGASVLRRTGGGAEFRSERWRTSALALRRGDDEHDLGLRTMADYRLGDRWRVGASLDLDSSDTPLRGRRLGLTTDVLGAAAELKPNESGGVAFGWRHREHSDGNEGDSYFAQGWFRVRNSPRFKLDVTGDLAAANNATDQVAYFSPRHDLFALAGMRHTARLYRRDERSLNQVVDLGGGRYDQAGYGSGRLWRLGYRLEIDLRGRWRAALGAERARMFYDGAPEYTTAFTLELGARL